MTTSYPTASAAKRAFGPTSSPEQVDGRASGTAISWEPGRSQNARAAVFAVPTTSPTASR
ncbi:hypothetical protein LZG04_04430 [Saccharothrix sp. S26]|uniref:hypothetical protein n=1 Tax=Saccharothrix sp. S26 TaxID=2907215 RepID=UPI001F18E223|nr:hypothetical protein [Saccharothrix sp. S26]MCE6994063.1 hypothetical protein [Saccharothrix sp. S26]